MQKSYIPFIIIAIIIIAGGVIMFTRGDNEEPANFTINPPPTAEIAEPSAMVAAPPPSQVLPPPAPVRSTPPNGTFSGEEDIDGGDIMVHEIVYNGSKYSPSALTIKQGDIVRFKNESLDLFWPASSPHPVHTDYPEFDAKVAIAAGKAFDFKFTKVGTWKFHDHIKPSAFGSITVTQ